MALIVAPADRPYGGGVLVLTRHRLPLPGHGDLAGALDAARDVLGVLAERPGFLRGWVARSVDDPDLLVLAHEWADVGSYRRALSSYEVKLRSPFLQTAADEASAFEVLVTRTPDAVSESPTATAVDGAVSGPGRPDDREGSQGRDGDDDQDGPR